MLDVMFDCFNDNNGVVHHESNREKQTEKRKGIDGKSKKRKEHKRADERYRDCQQRYERGAPALQEYVDNNDDENKGLNKCFHDLADALGDRQSGVKCGGIVQARRKTLFCLG